MKIKIQIEHEQTSVEILLDKNINAKKAFEIQKILKKIGNQVVECGIKNDVKKYFEKGKR